MMTLVTFFALVFSISSFANSYVSTEECILTYRDGAVELREAAQRFNRNQIDRYEMSVETTRISTLVAAQRLACRVVEDPNARRCIESAKQLYESIRNEINVRSIGFGNQTRVKLPFDFIPKLTLHDLRC